MMQRTCGISMMPHMKLQTMRNSLCQKPHKYWVFTDQIGVLKVGRKWANGHKFDQNRPNPSPKFPAFLKKPT